MAAVDEDSTMSKENPIKLEPINENSPSTSITTPTNPGVHVQSKTQDFSNTNRTTYKKTNDSKKDPSKRKHIIIITCMVCTFVGSASGLVVLYSHLNEIEAGEDAGTLIFAAKESGFQYPSVIEHEPSMMERCRTRTNESIRNCFDVDEYFSETTTEKKCSYLETVGTCVMDNSGIQPGHNCSELLEILIHITPGADSYVTAEAYLQVDIRECPFYNETAVEIVRQRGSFVPT